MTQKHPINFQNQKKKTEDGGQCVIAGGEVLHVGELVEKENHGTYVSTACVSH